MINMNKYQKYCFFGTSEPSDVDFIFSPCFPSIWELERNEKSTHNNFVYGKFDVKTDTYTVFQDEDITIVEYTLAARKYRLPECIDGIFTLKNEEWHPVTGTILANGNQGYKIVLNFNNRIQKIKFVFKNDIADDYIIEINYVEADKQTYYDKLAQKRKDELLKAANIKCSTGADLVNIYFQPCCSDYLYTEIFLYCQEKMLAKYKVDNDCYFKSINGLAYGNYSFVIKQYGTDEKVIIESDPVSFRISPPRKRPNKPIVMISN